MKIAVIGATGMIGHHTARAVLDQGHELVILRREHSDMEKIKELTFVDRKVNFKQSTSIAEGLQGIDAVIHCGAYYPTGPKRWQEDVKLAKEQMETFYQACLNLPLKKIVYVGAAIALPKNENGLPGDERLVYSNRPANKTPYLQVKYELDELARFHASQGLPVVIGIPSMCFGEYDYGPTTGRLIVDICNEEIPAYIEGNRNVVYAGDAGRGLVLAAEKGRPGERYLFTGTNISMKELTEKIATVAGVAAPSKKIPLQVAKWLARGMELKAKFSTEKKIKLDSTAVAIMALGQFLNGEKAQNELGYKPSETVDETIQRTMQWFKEAGYVKKR